MMSAPPQPAPGGKVRLSPRHQATLALVGAWVVFFAPQLLDTDGVPYFRDIAQFCIPVRAFLHASLLGGALPEWYPYELTGAPFIGQIATATFHPQTLLFLPFSPVMAVKLNILAAYLAGAAGAYRFARALSASRPASLAAAASLAFGGYAAGMNNLPYLMGTMTLPWVGCAAVRVVTRERLRDAGRLGLVWALVLLAGDAQAAGMAAVLVLGAMLMRPAALRRVLLLSLGGLLAAWVAAVELLPASVVYGAAGRMDAKLGSMTGTLWAVHPYRLFELFIPGFVPDRNVAVIASSLFQLHRGDLWSTTIFAGGLTLCLAALAISRGDRRTISFSLVAAFAVWMSLGVRGGLWSVAASALPLVGRLAYPEKYLALLSATLVPLVALGFDVGWQHPRRATAVFLSAAAGATLLSGSLALFEVAGRAFASSGSPLPTGSPVAGEVQGAWLAGMVTTGIFLTLGAVVAWSSQRRPATWPALTLLVFLELWRGNQGHLPLVSRAAIEQPRAIEQFLASREPPGQPPIRVYAGIEARGWMHSMRGDSEVYARGLVASLAPLLPALHGIGVTGQYMLPAVPSRVTGLIASNALGWTKALHGCARVAEASVPLATRESRLTTDDDFGFSLIGFPCSPYARLSGAVAAASVSEAEHRLATAAQTGTIAWEGGPAVPAASGTASVREYHPGRIVVETTAEQRSALLVAETFSPGWTARVDGAEGTVYAANVASLGVELPPGRHSVELSYRTPRLLAGGLMSLLGLVLCGLAMSRRPRRLPGPESSA